MAAKSKTKNRTFDARRDTLDFRDNMFQPTLLEVPTEIKLEDYLTYEVPVLDQGQEGACTGFGLATVANYLLRKRKVVRDDTTVSARMLYEMARRYDEWPGEDYSGSSARGAMKGWHKHGICGEECWPYKIDGSDEKLNEARTSDAIKRPLGAYYRVNHKDIVAIHNAMAEVGILYATAQVHQGWMNPAEGKIVFSEEVLGGHAFAIVAYNGEGLWIQNSWGDGWGQKGIALLTYDDWLLNGTDMWVARLGVPITLMKAGSTAIAHSASAGRSQSYSYSDLRPHIISIGNDGVLKPGGDFGTSANDVDTIFTNDLPRVTKNWKKKRLLLYAHGGLVSETAAVQRLAEYRQALLDAEVYPISFIWRSDAWTTITNILQDALRQRKPEGFLDAAKDFLLDRLDDALEPVARVATGKLQWDEMKENALLATSGKKGGALLALQYIAALSTQLKDEFEIHFIAHSAGSIFIAPMVQMLTTQGTIKTGPLKGRQGLGLKIESLTLWAPAITVELFKQTYLSSIAAKSIDRFAIFALTNKAEEDDNCAHIYNKSLLYLVSNAFEEKQRIPFFRDGVPILGMQKFLHGSDEELEGLLKLKNVDLVLAPNSAPVDSPNHSDCTTHGGFDDNIPTVKSTLARILNSKKELTGQQFTFKNSASSLMDRRSLLNSKLL